MSTLSKILLAILSIVLVGAIGFIIYQQYEMKAVQAQISSSMVAQKTLLDGITRSQAEYATKADLDAFAAANNVNLATIQKDVDTLGATITGMNQVVVSNTAVNQTNLPSTNTTPNTKPTTPTANCNGTQIPCPEADPYKYQQNVQSLSLTEPFSAPGQTTVNVPLGSVSFDASKQTPWSENLLQRTYSVSNVLATDQNGKQYVYNQFSITTNGKTYKAPITTAAYVQQYPMPSFSWWSPRLYLGADAGLGFTHLPLTGEFTPNVSFGFLSYGQTKVSPDWSFGQVGIGYGIVSRDVQIQIAPAMYNIGENLPVIQNTFVGPVLGIGFNGDVSAGVGIRVGL